jgi:hypothetical protein
MHRAKEQASLPRRVLARTLADEILKVAVGGDDLGPTTVTTGGKADMTNGSSDNDGPHIPPPI